MPGNAEWIDEVFSALSDGNRRRIIELLHEKDATLLELADHFPISLQALSKHIKILESARILTKEKQGKYRILSLNRNSLQPSLRWISFYSNLWNESLDKLSELINKNHPDGDAE